MIKFHCEHTPALRSGTQLGGITKHLGQWDGRVQCLGFTRAHFHALDVAPAGINLAKDIANVFVRYQHFHLHDRFEHDRSAPTNSFFESKDGCHLECHLI